ncbi:MAG TPA: phage holin family protein [Gammaproteobacteria bacterium]|nr:phage holin family protein [Gammaproteobacteria bacterium]
MLTGFLFIWLITALGLWIVTRIVPGVRVNSTGGLLWASLVLGLVNAFIRPILWILTLPLTVFTFGLFALVINAFTLWLTAAMVKDFEIDGFGSALLAALVMALLGVVGFILLSWMMMGEVHWMVYRSTPGMAFP